MRNHLRTLIAVALFVLCAAFPSFAQSGQLANTLKQALQATATGTCPTDMMSPLLAAQCQQQQPQMGQTLAGLGPIQSTQFHGTQQSPGGVVEVYTVRFQRGSMVWMINLASDGRIGVLWSPGTIS